MPRPTIRKDRRCPECGELFHKPGLLGHLRFKHGRTIAAARRIMNDSAPVDAAADAAAATPLHVGTEAILQDLELLGGEVVDVVAGLRECASRRAALVRALAARGIDPEARPSLLDPLLGTGKDVPDPAARERLALLDQLEQRLTARLLAACSVQRLEDLGLSREALRRCDGAALPKGASSLTSWLHEGEGAPFPREDPERSA